jgi:hypothetical protein
MWTDTAGVLVAHVTVLVPAASSIELLAAHGRRYGEV